MEGKILAPDAHKVIKFMLRFGGIMTIFRNLGLIGLYSGGGQYKVLMMSAQ